MSLTEDQHPVGHLRPGGEHKPFGIEGACRYLVAGRMDITGARWGLDGAEAVLKLRALRSNGTGKSTGHTTWN
jgi:hypothetical protein